MTVDLSIIIPTHNRPDLLRACLASVVRHAPPRCEILVVDDASPQGAAPRAAEGFPGVQVLSLPRQVGFCAAANAGFRRALAPVVELLNDDTEVTAGWAEAPLARFSDSQIGAVAPLVLSWPAGNKVDSAGDSYHFSGVAAKRGHGKSTLAADLRPRPVFGASGSSAFFRREAVLRVGSFPETFGAYFEDVDLAFRLQRAGYRAYFEPSSRVLHHMSASYGQPRGGLLAQQSCNEERVFWRNLPATTLPLALPLHAAAVVAKAWLRWREGRLSPFLRGRLRAIGEWREIIRHRRTLDRLGPGDWGRLGLEWRPWG